MGIGSEERGMGRKIRTEVVAAIGVLVMTGLLLALYFYADNRLLTMDEAESTPSRLERQFYNFDLISFNVFSKVGLFFNSFFIFSQLATTVE